MTSLRAFVDGEANPRCATDVALCQAACGVRGSIALAGWAFLDGEHAMLADGLDLIGPGLVCIRANEEPGTCVPAP